MADERTEKATPKRQSEARSKGQIPKSADFNSSLMLIIGLTLISIYIPSIYQRFKTSSIDILSHLDPNKITLENFSGFFTPYIHLLFQMLMPIMLPLLICGILINYLQIGFLFTLETIRPKLDKFSPMSIVSGFGKFFNSKSFVELFKSFLKMGIVSFVGYSVITSHQNQVLTLLGANVEDSLNIIGSIILGMTFQICIVMLLLGIADKKYQTYEFDKSMKMTKQEVKDEQKNAEGDPKVKAKIKSIQMQFALQRMSSAVPKADVIVVNPTHYAVALRYDTEIAPAPQVIAKGIDFIAFKIKEIAKNNNIPIVENKPLARTLYKIVPLDGLIPAELYVAVAEVLAFVYKTGKRRKVRS